MTEQRQENNKTTKQTIENLRKKKLAMYDEANNKVPHVLIQEVYLCPCPAALSTHTLAQT